MKHNGYINLLHIGSNKSSHCYYYTNIAWIKWEAWTKMEWVNYDSISNYVWGIASDPVKVNNVYYAL